jgi:hypothetical protein
MKKQVNKVGVFLKLATVFGIVGFYSAAQAAIAVNMKVNSNEDKLTVTTNGTCISGANSKGCVKAQGRQPINFNLTGSKDCSDGGKWKLDYVALGVSEGSAGNISSDAASDFNADQSSGEVTPNSQNASYIQIRNNNTSVYDIWYTVYATCGDSVIDSDPRIENDGSGRN